MEVLEYRAVFTDLDSLLDTRIATLLLLKPELANKLIETGEYLLREMDTFEFENEIVTLRAFDYFYKLRKAKLLTMAPPTNIIKIATKVILDYNLSADMKNPNNHFKILVNTYPYKLGMVDSAILMGKLTGLIGNIADINMVYLEPNEISIDYFKDNNVNTVILYDGYETISRAILKSGILSESNIPNINFLTSKPRFPLSKNNNLLANNFKYPEDIENVKKMISLVIPTTFLGDFLFSYAPVEK